MSFKSCKVMVMVELTISWLLLLYHKSKQSLQQLSLSQYHYLNDSRPKTKNYGAKEIPAQYLHNFEGNL